MNENNSLHTSSSLRKYNRCPRLWYYYHKALVEPPYPMTENKNIAFGSCFHQCVEVIMLNKLHNTNMNWKDKLVTYDINIQKMVTIVVEAALEFDDFINNVTPIAAEEELFSTYKGVNIGGKIDCIGEYQNNLWVIDYKTSSRNVYEKRYRLEPQMNIYHYLAHRKGYKVNGAIVYHVRVPALKQKIKETDEEFHERVKEDMLQQTLFPNSRRTSYFNVLKYEKKRETVIEAMEDICATVDMIEQEDELYKSEGGVAYRRNTTACFDFMKACEFYDVCSGEIKEEYLVKAESAHPELEMTKT